MKITKQGIAVLENDSHISKWVEEEGRLDHDQNALPRILPHIKQGSVIFDIGAFIGDHTIAYERKGRVHAFEPNKEAFECIKYNMRGKNAVSHCIAFSDKVHGYDIIKSDNAGMAQISNKETSNSTQRTSTIDIYCKDLGVIPDFIKIDAEGYELKILKGGEKTIKTNKPVLVLEVNEYALEQAGTSRKELFEYLDSIGYIYSDIYGEPLETLHTQFDIICYAKNN